MIEMRAFTERRGGDGERERERERLDGRRKRKK